MPNSASYLKSIQHKLQQLRWRFCLVVAWHCLLLYSLLMGLIFMGRLAAGLPVSRIIWPVAGWGLVIPLGYAGYRLSKRPSLSQIARLVDRRFELHDELVTAWQYRHSEQPVLPLLLERVSNDLEKIKSNLVFGFKVSRWVWIAALFLLAGGGYFGYYPLYKSLPLELAQPTMSRELSKLADQLEGISKELSKLAPEKELPRLVETADRFEQLAQKLEHSGDKSQVKTELEELKRELTQSLPAEAGLPEAAPESGGGDEPALLEVDIDSAWLAKRMQKFMQQGDSPEQIQNRILRELVNFMDSMIRINLPAKGGKSATADAQSAGTSKGSNHIGEGASPAMMAGVSGDTDTEGSEYSEADSQDYQLQAIDQSGLQAVDVYRLPSHSETEEAVAKVKYHYLSPGYQQRVYSVLSDQQIPLAYRRQVRNYFDALIN
jgi:hypothetical protein